MEVISAIISGLAQGITEFLPISSSGHLILLHEVLPLQVQNPLLFDIALHWATALAVIIYFAKDLVRYIIAWFNSLQKRKISSGDERMAWYIIIGTIPVAIVGYFISDVIDQVRTVPVVVTMLIVVALLFFIADRFYKPKTDYKNWKIKDVLWVGIAQALALIPGTSRSGITIIAGMWRGVSREQAARFSFLLSIPAVIAAGVKQMIDFNGGLGNDIHLYLVGFFTALLTGYFAIHWLLKFLNSHKLSVFAWYRIVLAIIVILMLVI